MTISTDGEVVIDRNDICGLDAAVCLFFVVLRVKNTSFPSL